MFPPIPRGANRGPSKRPLPGPPVSIVASAKVRLGSAGRLRRLGRPPGAAASPQAPATAASAAGQVNVTTLLSVLVVLSAILNAPRRELPPDVDAAARPPSSPHTGALRRYGRQFRTGRASAD